MKKIIPATIILVLLGIGIVFFMDNRTKGLYDSCTKACKDNRTCIEYSGDIGAFGSGCAKYSDGECLNLCISKYK